MKVTIEKVENGYLLEYPIETNFAISATASMLGEKRKMVFKEMANMVPFLTQYFEPIKGKRIVDKVTEVLTPR
jgi:hypothetical protein